MLKFAKPIWAVIVTAATLIGIFYIPVDAIGIEEAAGPWRKVAAMIDQNTALWIFGIGTTLYIGWIDFRPAVRKWIEGVEGDQESPRSPEPIEVAYSNELAIRLFRLADRIVALEAKAYEVSPSDFKEELLGMSANKDIFCSKGTAAEKWRKFQSAAKLVNSAVNAPELDINVTPDDLFARVHRDQGLKRVLRTATSELIEELVPIG